MRRATSSIARLAGRQLAAETSATSRSLVIRALAPAAQQLLNAAPASGTAAFARSGGALRNFSEEPYFNSILYPESELEVGCPAPDFKLSAVVDGEIRDVSLSDYKGQYVILFWYPKDFTFVCPTEIIAFSDRAKEFEALNCQLLAASTDTPEVHLAWIKTPRKRGGLGYMQIPILADVTKETAARYGVLKRDAGIALRGLYIINPEGVVEHVTINNFPVGRNVDEALRTLQAVQYVAAHGEVCPAGWKPGAKTMIADPDKSLEYFDAAEAGKTEEVEAFGQKLTKIGSKQEYDDLVASGKKVLVKFWAPWCGKCRMIGPLVDDLQEKYPGVTVASFDTSDAKLEQASQDLGVKALPAFKFYKDGQEVLDQIIGYKRAPLAAAIDKLNAM